MKNGRIVWIVVLGVFILLADQIFKYFAVKYSRGGFFNWKIFDVGLFKNEGIAFGIIIPIEIFYVLVVLVLYVIYKKYKKDFFSKDRFVLLAITLICTGALSNILDRLIRGYVVDYIHFFDISAFNLADVSIVVGVVLLVWKELKTESRNKNQEIKKSQKQ